MPNPPVTIIAGGEQITTRAYARGGGKPQPIPDGQVFAGRVQGGGTRPQVYSTSEHARGFPFYFWPVAWATHPTEYGPPDNAARPGGALTTLTYVSRAPSGTTLRVLTDLASAQALLGPLSTCAPLIHRGPSRPAPYAGAAFPLPEQAVQHYRASSAVLTLDGYNNTAVLRPEDVSTNALLPGGTDTALLRCVNATLGSALLLADSPQRLGVESVLLIVIAAVLVAVVAVLLLLLCAGSRCRSRGRCLRRDPRVVRATPVILKTIDGEVNTDDCKHICRVYLRGP